jgi:hypothetical protein
VDRGVFEERIVLVWAASYEEACAKVHAEADWYRVSHPELEMLDCTVVHCTQTQEIGEGTEVWSIRRETRMDAEEYARQYHSMEKSGLRAPVLKEAMEAPV